VETWRTGKGAAMRLFLVLGALVALAASPVWGQPSGVVVNDYRLSMQELAQLGGAIPAGDYWYDSVGGFWGHIGGPTEGQALPGYNVGRLRADASNGNTGTFINGRELTYIEVAWLSRQVPVQRGHFWMNPQGVFGYEGGGPLGQIVLGGQSAGGNRPSLSERGMLFRPGEILSGH
jgi:hypothetical protein